MNEERKEYSVKGTVTIGTDEYRDLIEATFESKKSEEFYRNRYWEEQSKTKKLEEENTVFRVELEKYKKFVKENNEQDKLELWLVRIQRDE